MICLVENRPWKVSVDGALSAMGPGAGIVIITLEGIHLEHSFRLGFKASNNEAEYKALLARLKAILRMGAHNVEIYSNSRLIVNQVQVNFEARDPRMKAYLQAAKQIMNKFGTAKVCQVGQAQNRHADSLATLASSMTEEVPRLIKVELIAEPSISVVGSIDAAGDGVTMISATESCWMDPIIDFLVKNCVSDNEKEANRIR